jgi:hypothetical protein
MVLMFFNTLGAEGFFIISVASAGGSAIFTHLLIIYLLLKCLRVMRHNNIQLDGVQVPLLEKHKMTG